MSGKKFYAYQDIPCDKCPETIGKEEQFFWFEGDKICNECWNKLVNFYEDEM